MSFSCLSNFFAAVEDNPSGSRYFLGLRLKSPGADLVLFRKDTSFDPSSQRGGGFIFHYNGYNGGMGGDVPQLAPVHNIRNTLLFEVSAVEYKALENQIDMMRMNGPANPYYFSRELKPFDGYERHNRQPVGFSGEGDADIDDFSVQFYRLPEDSIPFTRVNCVHMAVQMLAHIGRINLDEISSGFSRVSTGKEYAEFLQDLERKLEAGEMPESLKRECLLFNEDGELAQKYAPPKVGSGMSYVTS